MRQSIEAADLVIDVNSIIPLYHQIKTNLRQLIEDEVLRGGEPLPSERDLGDMYGVNRLTVRQALNDLVSEGVLRRKRGVGTFVAEPKLVQSLGHVFGFSDRVREANRKPSSRSLSLEIIPAPPRVARRLGIAPNVPVYELVRLRLSDDEPVMLETAYLSAALFPGLLEIDFSNQSLYHLLSEKYDCNIREAEEILEPVIMTAYEVEMLQAEPGTPGMLVESVAYDQHGKIVEIGRSVVRGDKSRFFFRIKHQVENNSPDGS